MLDAIEYDTGVRNKAITVRNPKVQYSDQLTGYKYEAHGRIYYETIEHGYIERSHFSFGKPMRNSCSLDTESVAALNQLRKQL